jgi:putative ABC transport system ATP-binding protein
MIKLENVHKSYGSAHVLRGVGLTVDKGDFLAVTGSSGSGKSTLLNLIGGMDRPETGTITVNAEAITSYDEKRLTLYRRRKIGFVFQFFNLLPNITVFENIRMPLLLNGIEDTAMVQEFIERVGLSEKKISFPWQLSGGEQQRVAIARALIHDPDIILADEPTGSLDTKTGESIMGLFTQLVSGTGKTVILVTHERYITRYANRTVLIRDGLIL